MRKEHHRSRLVILVSCIFSLTVFQHAFAQETTELITIHTEPTQSDLFRTKPLIAATDQYLYFDSAVDSSIVTHRYDPDTESLAAINSLETLDFSGIDIFPSRKIIVEPTPGLFIAVGGVAIEPISLSTPHKATSDPHSQPSCPSDIFTSATIVAVRSYARFS